MRMYMCTKYEASANCLHLINQKWISNMAVIEAMCVNRTMPILKGTELMSAYSTMLES